MARYFYAGGERHELELADDRLAIDTRVASDAGLGDVVSTLPVTSTLPSGMRIVDRASIDDALLARLRAAGVVQPVHRYGNALVVPMPDVRVEIDGDQRVAVLAAIDASPVAADVTEDTPERISLRPRSGRGEDALDLANYIHEHAHPAASSARLLQVVPKRGA